MAAITAKAVAELREMTGSGMMDCKRALQEADGDVQKAVDLLREKGLASAAKKAGRIAAEGIVESYIHMGGRIGVLIEVNCETDFVAKMPEFKAFVHNLAMHVAAAKPLYVSEDEISEEDLNKEREIQRAKALNEGKPEKIVDRIVDGQIKKYKEEVCLLNQKFVMDTEKTVQQIITDQVATIGEKISVRRFVRYEMGEGLAKREDNFAEEVMKQAGM